MTVMKRICSRGLLQHSGTVDIPVAVPVRADKVSVDDAQCQHERCKRLQVKQEGLPYCPAHQHHHWQHKDCNLHSARQ